MILAGMLNMELPLNEEKQFTLSPKVRLRQSQLRDAGRLAFLASDEVGFLEVEGSRYPAISLDSHSYDLICRFNVPISLRRAVSEYALQTGKDPAVVLRASWDLLSMLISRRVLITSESSLTSMEQHSLPEVGGSIHGWRIDRLVRRMSDFAIFLVSGDSEKQAIAKMLVDPGDLQGKRRLGVEHQALNRLAGKGVPDVVWCGEYDDRTVLLTNYHSGVTLNQWVRDSERQSEVSRKAAVFNILKQILTLYSNIHGAGVLHGDVHPGNLLVDDQQRVTVIDFDSAIFEHSPNNIPMELRANPRFLSPELATQLLAGETVSSVTIESELFSVAAMLFYVASGSHYVHFPLEKKEILQAVVNCSVLRFEELGRPSWPELEIPLRKALSKKPAERLAGFNSLFAVVAPQFTDGPSTFEPHRSAIADNISHANDTSEFFDRLCDPLRIDEHLKSLEGRSGLWNGAAGVAYSLLLASRIEGSAKWLGGAMMWALRASDILESKPAIQSESKSFGIAEGPPGVYAVQALVADACGMLGVKNNAIMKFLDTCCSLPSDMELLHGRAGLLYACGCLRAIFVNHSALAAMGEQLAEGVFDALTPPPWTEVRLGMAHGIAGELFALLKWAEVTDPQMANRLLPHLEEFSRHAAWSTDVASWPARLGDSPSEHVAWWCNGTAGIVHLWLGAARLFADRSYHRFAEAAGNHIWSAQEGLSDLCCGLSGRALALDELAVSHQVIEISWNHRAARLMEGVMEKPYISGRPLHDLAKGTLGVHLANLLIHRTNRIS